jgi:hypothetical protein
VSLSVSHVAKLELSGSDREQVPARREKRRRLRVHRASPFPAECGQPLHAYNAAAGRQGRAFGPLLRRALDGAPLTAVSGVVRLGHARTPPQKPQLRTGTASLSLSALNVSYLLQITPDFA